MTRQELMLAILGDDAANWRPIASASTGRDKLRELHEHLISPYTWRGQDMDVMVAVSDYVTQFGRGWMTILSTKAAPQRSVMWSVRFGAHMEGDNFSTGTLMWGVVGRMPPIYPWNGIADVRLKITPPISLKDLLGVEPGEAHAHWRRTALEMPEALRPMVDHVSVGIGRLDTTISLEPWQRYLSTRYQDNVMVMLRHVGRAGNPAGVHVGIVSPAATLIVMGCPLDEHPDRLVTAMLNEVPNSLLIWHELKGVLAPANPDSAPKKLELVK